MLIRLRTTSILYTDIKLQEIASTTLENMVRKNHMDPNMLLCGWIVI